MYGGGPLKVLLDVLVMAGGLGATPEIQVGASVLADTGDKRKRRPQPWVQAEHRPQP